MIKNKQHISAIIPPDLRGSTTDVERDSTWFGMRNQLFTRRWWRDQAREKLTYSRNRHWWKSEDDPGNTGEGAHINDVIGSGARDINFEHPPNYPIQRYKDR